MKCEKCGAEIKRGDKFCNACGFKISKPKPSLQDQLKDFSGKVTEFGESIDWEQKGEQLKDKFEQLRDKGSDYVDKVENKIEARKQEKEERKAAEEAERAEYFESVPMETAYSEPETEEIVQTESCPKSKKRKTWLWVLGWIFIFPVPLTLVLLRKTNMNKVGKYAALAGAWLLYLIIVWPTNSPEQKDTQVQEPTVVASVDEVEKSAEENSTVSTEEPTREIEEVVKLVPEEKEETKVSFTSQVNSVTGFILFKVSSNLPEDTKLIVKATNDEGYEETDTVTILSDGEGNTKEFFSSEKALDGDYTISVMSEDGEEYCSRKQSFTNKERAALAKAEEEAKAKELVEAEAAKAEAEKETTETKPEFTFTDCSGVKYPSMDINVRNKPNTSGDKVGAVSKNQEVVITGQCNETGWYRIKYGDGEAYAHNAYLLDEKTIDTQVATAEAGAAVAGGTIASSGGGASVTVPDVAQTGADMVWIPTNGGTKYHCKSSCSNMVNPMQVTREQAEANGFTPCGRCHP